MKTGFVELNQTAYVRIINHRKVLQAGLQDFIMVNAKVRALFQDFQHQLTIGIGKETLAIAGILDGGSSSSNRRGKRIQILFREDAIPLLLTLRSGGALRKMRSLLQLVLFRRVKIRSNSPMTVLRFAWRGVSLLV